MKDRNLRRRSAFRQVRILTVVGCLMISLITGIAHRSKAEPASMAASLAILTDYDVYLYEGGFGVLQPTDSVQMGGVFTDTDVFVGSVVFGTDDILDSDNNVIGFVEPGGPE